MLAQRLYQGHSLPSAGILAMNGLSTQEMEELATQMVEMAEAGHFNNGAHRGPHRKGNLIDSPLFAGAAGDIADRGRDHNPEYRIASDLTVLSGAAEARMRIEGVLSALRRPEKAKPGQIFSKSFLAEFDWITQNRGRVVAHAVNHQRDFVGQPNNPLLLKDLKQQDLADVVGCHSTTISRLIKDLMIELPDTTVREFALLVPGNSISSLKGRYVVGLLSRDPCYYDRATGTWKVSDEDLARILGAEYNLEVKRRGISNYRQWVDEYLLKPRRTPGRDDAPEVREFDEPEDSEFTEA